MSDNNSSKFFLKQYVLLKRCQWRKREEERNRKKNSRWNLTFLPRQKLSQNIKKNYRERYCKTIIVVRAKMLGEIYWIRRENEMFMQREKQQKQVQHKLFSARSLCFYGCISSHFSINALCHGLRREIFSISRVREEAFWVVRNGRHSRRN